MVTKFDMARQDGIEEVEQNLNGAGLRIGIVMSRFNLKVGEGLLNACNRALSRQRVATNDILIFTVPGALEVPLALQKLAQTGKFDALIALGVVIRGETYHFEIVASESANGITSVQLDTGVPVANCILTTDSEDQALSRIVQKGTEAALVAIEMANLLKQIKQPGFGQTSLAAKSRD